MIRQKRAWSQSLITYINMMKLAKNGYPDCWRSQIIAVLPLVHI